jgi:FAD/FMN-containing dehydrogenase
MKNLRFGLFLLVSFISIPAYSQDNSHIVNDITQLNPIRVDSIITPTTTEEIINAVKNYNGPISIGGGRYSMGGQTAIEKALQIDMRKFNKVLNFSKQEKEITVQTGIRWRDLLQYIDSANLSIRIMQTYANFTVGGSLSVNVHGRYNGTGPLLYSVKQIKIVLASGALITASPTENADIFYGAIGGYGGLGVITEATLSLTDNCKVERSDKVMPIKNYKKYYFDKVRSDSSITFHNADIYPNKYKKVRAVSYIKTNKEVTIKDRIKPVKDSYSFNRFGINVTSAGSFGKWMRQHIFDPIIYMGKPPVEWRNYEASYDVKELEPKSRKKSTYILQEYFVPVDSFDVFYPRMASILRKHKANIINISIRHANKDPGSLLAWAKTEVFAFVIYYKQGTQAKDNEKTKAWTRELIDAVIISKGSYYLPYQIFATSEQFASCYPNANLFFQLKKKVDPTNKFRNKLWTAYYK